MREHFGVQCWTPDNQVPKGDRNNREEADNLEHICL